MLSKVAKGVLAIPVSIVASESAFSTGGHIVDPFRSSLSSHGSKPCMCTKLASSQSFDFSTPIKG